MKKVETLIIGAGPAGLAAAVKLAKTDKDFLIIEKDNQVGGLAKTYEFREGDCRTPQSEIRKSASIRHCEESYRGTTKQSFVFRADNGPHRFFSKNQYLYRFIQDLLKEQWLEVPRQTRQFIGGKFYHYPIRPAQALANIGLPKATQMAVDYLIAQLQFIVFRKKICNFEDYIVANFGRSLGKFNMINYTEKIWGMPAATIHTDWAIQRIKGLSVPFLIKMAAKGVFKNLRTEGLRTLINTFHYPEHGNGLIYEAIKKKLEKQGHEILLNTQPVKIRHNNKNRITEVVVRSANPALKLKSKDTDSRFRRDENVIIQPANLIESIPINEFVHLLDPSSPPEVLAAVDKIKYRDQVYLFLTLNKERVTRDQWIYFPEKHIPFGRISEMKNFSQKMSPPGKTSLLIEFFCFKNDAIWNKPKDELLQLTMAYLERWGFCSTNDIRNCYLIKKEKSYPIYDIHYKKHLTIIKNYLNNFENLYYIGRPGRFRYNNQDHSLAMGFLAAQSIVENHSYNLEAVGMEQEHYEIHNRRPLFNKSTGQTFKQFIGYSLAAGVATIVDLSILYSLTEFLGFWYFNAAIVSYMGGIVTNYLLGKTFVFHNRSRAVVKQFSLFTFIALIGLIINQVVLYLLVEYGKLWYIWAKIVAIGVATIWSFTGHKKLTFKIYV